MSAMRHPVVSVFITLVVLTGIWQLIGAPIGLITQIAIYTLYGAGVCLLVSYTGLVPFGASVFFGCASYAVAVVMLRGGTNATSREGASAMSRGGAPDWRITSGKRNDPPISTNSPRETTTGLPAANPESASSTAAAQLLTTSASSAPVRFLRSSRT